MVTFEFSQAEHKRNSITIKKKTFWCLFGYKDIQMLIQEIHSSDT